MPRKTPIRELQKEEVVISSPLRRSSRISSNSPAPTKVLSRRNSATETSTSTPRATRGRRASFTQDQESTSEAEVDQKNLKVTSTPRTRRGSFSSNNESNANAEETTTKIKTRGSSVPKEQIAESKKPATRRRRSVSQDVEGNEDESVKKITRSRSGSLSKKNDNVEDTKSKVENVEDLQDHENSNTHVSTPFKKSPKDNVNTTLESIEEINKEADSPVAVEPTVNITKRKKTETVKIDLELSIINEASLTEEDIIREEETKTVVPQKVNEDKNENQQNNIEDKIIVKENSSIKEKITTEVASDVNESSLSENSFHLQLSSSLLESSNKNESDGNLSPSNNKENVCPQEKNSVQESECEPMDVDESFSEIPSPIKSNKIKSADVASVSKVNDVEKKIEIAEKVTDEIAQYLTEEIKFTSNKIEKKLLSSSDSSSVDSKQIAPNIVQESNVELIGENRGKCTLNIVCEVVSEKERREADKAEQKVKRAENKTNTPVVTETVVTEAKIVKENLDIAETNSHRCESEKNKENMKEMIKVVTNVVEVDLQKNVNSEIVLLHQETVVEYCKENVHKESNIDDAEAYVKVEKFQEEIEQSVKDNENISNSITETVTEDNNKSETSNLDESHTNILNKTSEADNIESHKVVSSQLKSTATEISESSSSFINKSDTLLQTEERQDNDMVDHEKFLQDGTSRNSSILSPNISVVHNEESEKSIQAAEDENIEGSEIHNPKSVESPRKETEKSATPIKRNDASATTEYLEEYEEETMNMNATESVHQKIISTEEGSVTKKIDLNPENLQTNEMVPQQDNFEKRIPVENEDVAVEDEEITAEDGKTEDIENVDTLERDEVTNVNDSDVSADESIKSLADDSDEEDYKSPVKKVRQIYSSSSISDNEVVSNKNVHNMVSRGSFIISRNEISSDVLNNEEVKDERNEPDTSQEIEIISDNENEQETNIEKDVSVTNENKEMPLVRESVNEATVANANERDAKEVHVQETIIVKDNVRNSLNRRSVDKTSIVIQENLKAGDDKEKCLSDRIHKVVDLFCGGIKNKGDVSINLSLEFTGQLSDGSDNENSIKNNLKDTTLPTSAVPDKTTDTWKNQKGSKRRKVCESDNISGPSNDVQEEYHQEPQQMQNKSRCDNNSSELSSQLSPFSETKVEERVKSKKKTKKRKSNECDDTFSGVLDISKGSYKEKDISPNKKSRKQIDTSLKLSNDNKISTSNIENMEENDSKLNKDKKGDKKRKKEKEQEVSEGKGTDSVETKEDDKLSPMQGYFSSVFTSIDSEESDNDVTWAPSREINSSNSDLDTDESHTYDSFLDEEISSVQEESLNKTDKKKMKRSKNTKKPRLNDLENVSFNYLIKSSEVSSTNSDGSSDDVFEDKAVNKKATDEKKRIKLFRLSNYDVLRALKSDVSEVQENKPENKEQKKKHSQITDEIQSTNISRKNKNQNSDTNVLPEPDINQKEKSKRHRYLNYIVTDEEPSVSKKATKTVLRALKSDVSEIQENKPENKKQKKKHSQPTDEIQSTNTSRKNKNQKPDMNVLPEPEINQKEKPRRHRYLTYIVTDEEPSVSKKGTKTTQDKISLGKKAKKVPTIKILTYKDVEAKNTYFKPSVKSQDKNVKAVFLKPATTMSSGWDVEIL